jgi:hypothetical protein
MLGIEPGASDGAQIFDVGYGRDGKEDESR